MKQKERSWLTTGQAAELCAVTPPTILNWIRKGRLEGVRTAGGHYRIRRQELESLRPQEQGSDVRLSTADDPRRPLRCWEYMAEGETPREDCANCVVYAVRAAWCFRFAKLDPAFGDAPRLCPTSCDNCAYYRRVMDLPTNVLVVTADRATVQHLAGTASESIALRFARNAYEASAVVEAFPPAFAVVDEDVITSGNGDLLNSIGNDPRLPGLKIVVAVASGAAHSLGDGTIRRATRLIEKPFGLRQIAAVIEGFPVEMVLLEGFDNWDTSPTRGRFMIQLQGTGEGVRAKTADGVTVNDDGFLETMSSWTRSSAEALALEHEIGPLTDEHWKVIEYVQEYYRTYGKGPPVVKVHKETGLTSADICRLFPCGMVKGAYRLAGLPRPPGCG